MLGLRVELSIKIQSQIALKYPEQFRECVSIPFQFLMSIETFSDSVLHFHIRLAKGHDSNKNELR